MATCRNKRTPSAVSRDAEMAAKQAFPKAKSDNVFGQRPKTSKMFCTGF
jgi:hypothetical protein